MATISFTFNVARLFIINLVESETFIFDTSSCLFLMLKPIFEHFMMCRNIGNNNGYGLYDIHAKTIY